MTQTMQTPDGFLAIVLHAHLPYVVNHGTWPHGMEWLHEAAAETYLPLLRVLVARGGKTLVDVHNEDHAGLLREDLLTVGVTREALFADDDLRMPLTFHGLRDTCLSHMAVRRAPAASVAARAGSPSCRTPK